MILHGVQNLPSDSGQTSEEYLLSVHRHEELLVVVGVDQTVSDGVHSLYGIHLGDELTDDPHAVERGLIMQQIVATSRRQHQVDGWEDTLVGERTVELDLGVTRSLEFLEDHLVHLRTGIHKRRGADGQ